MNMSDDVSGAVVGISSGVAQKGVEVTTHITDKVIDAIAKLLQSGSGARTGKSPSAEVTASDMTDIEPGRVGIGELVANARKTGDTVVSTDGYSKADMANITRKSEEYGIPIAFTGEEDKDNITAHIRGSDKAIFEQICTENMRDKIATRPQEFDNFKIDKWEIEGIQHELTKHDLTANWGKTKDGEYFCLFEKADKKAVLMARSEFNRKCGEVENDLTITKGEDGFYSLKDENSGKEITFDELPSKSELSAAFQSEFGYDENKANIACGKFGENQLDGADKRKFFADSPRSQFADIQDHIELKGENILAKDYDCLRLTPKADGVPCIVFKDEHNNFAVVRPETMTRAEMSEIIKGSLNIEDEKTVTALTEKADKLGDYYAKQNIENFTVARGFDNQAELDRTGNTHESALVAGNVESSVERLDKGSFKVVSTAIISSGGDNPTSDSQELVLSFSNKKAALAQLQQMYESQGVPSDVAKSSAKEVFKKAQAQSAEKVMQIEEIKTVKQSAEVHDNVNSVVDDSVMTVRYGSKVDDINITDDREATLAEIGDKFGADEKEAETLLAKAQEKNNDGRETKPIKEKPLNGHEKTPTEPAALDTKAPTLPTTEAPKVEIPTGGRKR